MGNLIPLYPSRSGIGSANPAEPEYFPEKLVKKLLKNGWSATPDFTNAKVVATLAEKAKAEIQSERAVLDQERAELEKLKAEIEASKSSKKIKAEV